MCNLWHIKDIKIKILKIKILADFEICISVHLKAVFHKFYLVHSSIPCPMWKSSKILNVWRSLNFFKDISRSFKILSLRVPMSLEKHLAFYLNNFNFYFWCQIKIFKHNEKWNSLCQENFSAPPINLRYYFYFEILSASPF